MALVSALAVTAGAAGTHTQTASATTKNTAVHSVAKKKVARAKTKPRVAPAPTTAAGYAAMFAKVPVSQWGGADVSISTRLPDGRRVWLYGDTLSARANGFVHSSAIVQNGGTLHVSRGGAQVLPNETSPTPGYQRIYWVETVQTVGPSTVRAVAAPEEVGTKSMWDFHRWSGFSHVADLSVSPTGDVTFKRWVNWVPRPSVGMDGEDFHALGPHHFTYAGYVHDITLSDGHYLKTVAQNWDDSYDSHHNKDGAFRFADYRPLFRESTTRTNPYWGH